MTSDEMMKTQIESKASFQFKYREVTPDRR